MVHGVAESQIQLSTNISSYYIASSPLNGRKGQLVTVTVLYPWIFAVEYWISGGLCPKRNAPFKYHMVFIIPLIAFCKIETTANYEIQSHISDMFFRYKGRMPFWFVPNL